MKLLYKKSFTKSYQALDESRREKIKKAISLFLLDPFLPLLNNHVLHGKWQ
jgi:mRNA-degrading endonuclease YafQ of YafQ-DinJ toxin-antitoxin module